MLDITIHGVNSPALTEHTNQRLTAALDQHADHVVSITVKLEDLNGHSRKGNDKRCHVTVKLKKDDPIIVEEMDDDLYLAISRAADRVKNVAGRKHERKMDKLHGKG